MFGIESFKEAFHEIVSTTANAIKQMIKDDMPTFQSNFKHIYSEEEAAEFLGLSLIQMKRYRRSGQINFISYPTPGELDSETQRVHYVAYFITDLLNFAEAHHREQFAVRETFKFKEVIEITNRR